MTVCRFCREPVGTVRQPDSETLLADWHPCTLRACSHQPTHRCAGVHEPVVVEP